VRSAASVTRVRYISCTLQLLSFGKFLQGFIGCVERVLGDASLRSAIVDNAYAVVTERYSTSREQEAYSQVVADVLELQCAGREHE